MNESADQLAPPDSDAPKKATKRRTTKATATVSRAKKTAASPAEETKPKATRKKATTTAKKKAASTSENTTGELPLEIAPASAPAPAAIEAPVAAPVPPPELPAAAPAPAPAAPTPTEAQPVAAAPAAPQQQQRKYPVYIPRTVAKQLEAEGKQVGIAVESGDDLSKEVMDQIAAATSHSQRQPRGERQPRPDRPDRPERAPQPPREREENLPPGLADSGESLPPELTGAPAILEGEPKPEELVEGSGIIEISGKGFGFLRDPKRNYAQAPHDIFVTPETVKHFHLRDGQMLKGVVRKGPRGAQLHKLETINGDPAEEVRNLPAFDELTVISPEPRITMETTPDRYTTRIIDLMCPIGRGQRALVVAPPRTGKTTFLIHMAEAVRKNHPDLHLMFLLVDERPEEVTDIKRSVPGAEIYASSNDNDVKSHTRIASLAIERARRLVEQKKHVFILLDSITRVGRAFNNAMSGGGRTGSGGLDSRALETPRRLFASARNTEEAGSLTIVGTTLVETNSRADEVIFQEFKGTGNMELCLDRKIAEQRVYPAIDIFMSGTRREELLIPEADLHKIHVIRRGLAGYKPLEAVERLLFFMKKFPTNAQMLAGIPG
jgi:transcription termination factor Rho